MLGGFPACRLSLTSILTFKIGGLKIARPSMRESTALGSALLAAHALGLFGWDVNNPDTLSEVNTTEVQIFEPQIGEEERRRMIKGWEKAVKRSMAWYTAEQEDEAEEKYEKESGTSRL